MSTVDHTILGIFVYCDFHFQKVLSANIRMNKLNITGVRFIVDPLTSGGLPNKSLNHNIWRTMATGPGCSSPDNLVVQHDPKNKKFVIKLDDSEAKLEYVMRGDVMDMWHTEVPPQLQGKGIAKILAKEAFEHVVQNKMKMCLSCSYLQKYFNDNPLQKYKDVVEK